jgi:UDP-glucose 4-epimerase
MSEKVIQKILVTGGAGFIGSHLIDCLMADVYEITLFDIIANGDYFA